MQKLAGFLYLFLALFAAGCNSGNASPTEAYKALFTAVKAGNTEAIKANMTKKTRDFAEFAAKRNNAPIEKVFANGFTATTFAEELPELRDERINGEFGALEVWNEKEKRWEDLPFVNEEGSWRLAIGELFAGTFRSPGKGQSRKELEAANAAADPSAPRTPNTSQNTTNTEAKPDPKPFKPGQKPFPAGTPK